jgi:hypothetical protein
MYFDKSNGAGKLGCLYCIAVLYSQDKECNDLSSLAPDWAALQLGNMETAGCVAETMMNTYNLFLRAVNGTGNAD